MTIRDALSLALLFSTLSGCAIDLEDEGLILDETTVDRVVLDQPLPSGSHDVYRCTGSDAIGRFAMTGSVLLRSVGFCIGDPGERGDARLFIDDARREACFWREAGYCEEDGECVSLAFADRCVDLIQSYDATGRR